MTGAGGAPTRVRPSASAAGPGQTPMWSGSASSRTRSRMPSGSVISRGSCSRPARSSTAYSTACCAASPSSPAVARAVVSVLVRPSLIAIDPAHHRRHRRVVRDDQHGHAELGVGRLQRAEHLGRGGACPARRSARRPAAPWARWPAPPRSRPAAARRRTSGPACGPAQSPTPSRSSSSAARARRARAPHARPAASAAPRSAARSGRAAGCARSAAR